MSSELLLRKPKRPLEPAPKPEKPKSSSIPRLQIFEELPSWYQDNPWVRSGYRPVSYSILSCIQSWTFLHNETLNIYTHLIPAVLSLFAQLAVQYLISHQFPDASARDRIVFGANLLAATATLTLSSGYHTLLSHSLPVSALWLRIDYVGILTLILGSFFSGIFVGFYCEHKLQWLYWSMIIVLSLVTSVLVLHPRLQGLEYRGLRTTAFIATAMSGFAPIGHGIWLYGWKEMWVRSGMPYWFLEGVFYGIGAFFFASRFPESIWPGKFDIFLGSHQIFHVLVVLAGVVHLWGVWNAYDWNYRNNRQCMAEFWSG